MTGVSARYRLGGYLGINGQKTVNQSCHLLLLPLYNTPGVGWGPGWGVQYARGGVGSWGGVVIALFFLLFFSPDIDQLVSGTASLWFDPRLSPKCRTLPFVVRVVWPV